MRVSAFFTPFFVVLAGITGFYLRISERLNVFDPITGLPGRSAETTIWLFTLTCVFFIVLVVFAINASMNHKAVQGFENAFGTDPFYYPILFVIIGILWVVGSYMHYSYLRNNNILTSIDIVFVVFSAISAISVTFFAIEMFQDSRRKAPYMLSVVPTLFMCFWLILMYRQNASNPVLLSYIYQCFAIIAAALSFYFTSGFLYGKPAPGKSIVAYYTSIYFCLVTLADGHPAGMNILFISLIFVNIIHSSMLLMNLRKR